MGVQCEVRGAIHFTYCAALLPVSLLPGLINLLKRTIFTCFANWDLSNLRGLKSNGKWSGLFRAKSGKAKEWRLGETGTDYVRDKNTPGSPDSEGSHHLEKETKK